ncbi:MAG: FadR family transcriptional regulator [Desulfobacula sp.]|nr:FadR family transcriptional regulator [Desulfobacula sp.]
MKKKLQYKPLKKHRLYEDVAEQIKKTIFNGDLKPGDQLPSERDLAVMFNVGRPTIREALRTLSVLGLIESNQGFKGSVVKKIDIAQYFEAMGEQFIWMIEANEKSFKEMWEVRKYVELGIAHLVAENASDQKINDLEKYIVKMENCGGDIKKYFIIAMDFHLKLAQISENKMFYFIWKVFYKICIKGYLVFEGMYPDKISKLLECNKIMLEAIKSRDPDKIDKAMKKHVEEEILISFNQ